MPPRTETVKWLVQNQTSRSRNGAGVVSALSSSAFASAWNSAPDLRILGLRLVLRDRPATRLRPVDRAGPRRDVARDRGVQLIPEPAARVGWQRLVAAAAQAEADQRLCGSKVHGRQITPEPCVGG